MASLTNNKIKDTYQSLVKFNDNGNITTSAKRLTDGFGNNSPFFVSTTQIGIGVTPTLGYDLHVNSNTKIGGNLEVGGNLTVSGTLTYLNVEDLATEDPLIKLARNNADNLLDIGFFGKYVESTVTKYKGLFNDADDNKWKLFIGTSDEPTTVVDTGGTGYTIGTLVANLEGNVTGGTISGTTATFSSIGEFAGAIRITETATAQRILIGNQDSGGVNKPAIIMGANANLYFGYGDSWSGEGGNMTNILVISSADSSSTFSGNILPNADSTYNIGANNNKWAEGHFDHLYVGETGNNPRIDIYTENGTASLADTFSDSSTDKSYIYFNAGTNSNDPAFIMHETSESTNPDERNEGVLHLVPSDDNNSTDYVSIHGTNDPDSLKLHTSGLISTANGIGLQLTSDTGTITLNDSISGTTGTFSGQLTIPETPTADAHAASKKYVDDNSGGDPDQTLAEVLATGNTSGANDIIMADDQKIYFGDNSDLFIVHNDTNGVIENIKGDLVIQNKADDKDIIFRSDNGSGGIVEYFRLDGSTNTIPFGRSPHITDNVKLYFGNDTANDASIKWDSTASELFIDGESKFLDNLAVVGAIKDSDGDAGTSGQVLSSTGTGTNWIDLVADVAKRIDVTVKNVSGGSLAKGTVVHAAPTATPPSGNVIEVIAADANDATKMPAIGVLNETIADEAEGEAVMFGAVSGIDTSSFSIGDELYVSETAGEFTATKPTAYTSQVQKIAVVIKSHASNGLIKVFGAGRANDVPNQIDRNVNFTDNSKLTFGDSTTPDLRLFHDGTNSEIRNLTGHINITNYADDKDIKFLSDNGTGGTEVYFELQGVSGGTNPFTVFPDWSHLVFGAGHDFRFYHNGTSGNSNIENYTGSIYITNYADDEDIVFRTDNGSGGTTDYIKLDGGDERIYVSKLMRFGDDVQLRLGDNNDIRLYHNSTDGENHIENHTGSLYITNYADDEDIIFRNDNGSGDVIEYFRLDGSTNIILFGRSPQLADNVKLYFGNSTADDASIKWDSTASQLFIDGSSKFLNDLSVVGNINANSGIVHLTSDAPILKATSNNNASGFRIQVNGLDGDNDDLFRVQDVGTTKFNLKRDGDVANDWIPFNNSSYNLGSSNQRWLNVYADNVYADNFYGTGTFHPLSLVSKVYNSTNTSSSISGGTSLDEEYELLEFGESASPVYLNLKSAAHSSASFVITRGYFGNNTASIQCTGSTYTANGGYPNVRGIRVIKDNNNAYKVIIRLYRSGSHSSFSLYARAWGGNADADINFSSTLTDTFTETTALGGITDLSVSTSLSAAYSRDTLYADNALAAFGNNKDLQIYHDGSHSYIQDSGTGRLIIKSDYFEVDNAAGNEAMLEAIQDGAVNLYYNGSKKFETTSTGISVNGQVVLSGDTEHYIEKDTTSLITAAAVETTTVSGRNIDLYAYDDINLRAGTGDSITMHAGGSERVRINSSGDVGIGTTSPSTKLHVNSVNAEASLTISRDGNNIVSGQGVGSIVFPADYNGTPTNYGKIVTYANALSSVRGSIDFKVKSTSGNLLTGLTVYGTFSGVNVGIGTTTPASVLHVKSTDTSPQGITVEGGDESFIKLLTGGVKNWGLITTNLAASDFGIYQSNSNGGDPFTAGTARLYFDGSGKVGIGTTSPSTKLHTYEATENWIYVETSGTNAVAGLRTSTSTGSRQNTLYRNVTSNLVTLRAGTDDGEIAFIAGGSANERMRIHENGSISVNSTNEEGRFLINQSGLGSTSGDEDTNLILMGSRHDLIFKQIRTANGSDWNNTTLRLQTRVDSTLMSSIDFVSDSSYARHIDINTASNTFNTRFTHGGSVGIATNNPSEKLSVASGNIAINNSNSFMVGGATGDTIIGRLKNSSGVLNLEADSTRQIRFGNGSQGELMRLNCYTKKIGIGVTNPSHKVHIAQNTAANLVHLLEQDNASYQAYYEAKSQNSGYVRFGIGDDADAYAFFNTSVTSYNWYHTGGGLLMTLNSNGHLGLGITNLTFAKLAVNGATYSSGGTFNAGTDTVTNAAFVLDEGDYIYTRDSSAYARKLIGKNTSDIIQIGQASTSLIDGMVFYSGNNADYKWYRNTSVAMQLYGSGSQPYEVLDVKGRIKAETDNGNSVDVPRSKGIPYQGSSGYYDFDPVAEFGHSKQGGYVLLEVNGWQTRFNAGYIHWHNNGGTGAIGTGSVTYRQIAWSGSASGAGVTVSTVSSSTNVIRISFSGWHGNAHGWKAAITNRY